MNDLLRQLTEAVGVSGAEEDVRALILELLEGAVDAWQVDVLGNLIVTKKAAGPSQGRILVDAHMDEVGLMIADHDANGTLSFMTMGGISNHTLLGKVVQVGADKRIGVIGAKPVHLLDATEREKMVRANAMRIDIGAANRDAAARKAPIGDRAAFITPYEELGRTAVGKAFDDRAGCAALITLLRAEPYPFDIYGLFSVQEEIGVRGAGSAAYGIAPDAAFVLECTPALDVPLAEVEDISPNVALGQGPGIYIMDSRTIQDPRLVGHVLRTAERHGIGCQIRQPGGGGTNSGEIQRLAGVPTATIGLPGRYLHTPVNMINLDDYDAYCRLAEQVLRDLNPDLWRPR